MARRYTVSLTGPQLSLLRSAADFYGIDMEDRANASGDPADARQAARDRATLDRAETALVRAQLEGEPDNDPEEG